MTASRAGTLMKGLGALAALLAAVVGVPLLLEAVAGSPIPTAIPAWDGVWASLTARDDGTLLLGILKYAAWAGWALFVLSVVADVVTRLRGLPAPRFGPQQHLATQLVGAVLALAVSVPTALPATAVAVPGSSAAPAGQLPVATIDDRFHRQSTASAHAVESEDEQGFDEYRVRRGDCLWDIAWNELGEPERWPEIYEASRSVRQPGGGRLTDPDLIVTGWVLHIPVPGAADSQHSGPAGRSTGQASTTLPEPPSKPDSVVTPFRSGPTMTRHLTHPATGTSASPFLVRTALSTPAADAGIQPGALERRWQQALAQKNPPIGVGPDWRTRLGPESD